MSRHTIWYTYTSEWRIKTNNVIRYIKNNPLGKPKEYIDIYPATVFFWQNPFQTEAKTKNNARKANPKRSIYVLVLCNVTQNNNNNNNNVISNLGLAFP